MFQNKNTIPQNNITSEFDILAKMNRSIQVEGSFGVIKENHIQKIKNKVKELSKKYQVTYKIDIEINPFFNNIDFIKEQNTASFMTEASFVKGKRIILGAGEVTAHEVDEHISIQSLQELVNQDKELIYKICY